MSLRKNFPTRSPIGPGRSSKPAPQAGVQPTPPRGIQDGPASVPLQVVWTEASPEDAGQRIDNFLIRKLKGIPKSHIYRILRSGEVRVNSTRVDPTYRLLARDLIRIPPLRGPTSAASTTHPARPLPSGKRRLHSLILYEDDALLALNKPAGWAVHGGSGIARGVIEQLRLERGNSSGLELVHRLDRETSGVLLIAKRRATLRGLHQQIREGAMDKRYLALIKGSLDSPCQRVEVPLLKSTGPEGERRVWVSPAGKPACTDFTTLELLGACALVEAHLLTGRTHQIRVHLAHLSHPIAGDDRYGDFAWNRTLQPQGLRRMFLHAGQLEFIHPSTQVRLTLRAPLPPELNDFLSSLRSNHPSCPNPQSEPEQQRSGSDSGHE